VQWCWQARLAVEEAQAEQSRRAELHRLAQEQARQDAQLLHTVGTGSFGAAAVLLNDLIDAKTGLPKRPAQARDVQPLVRVGIECLAAASGTELDGADPNGGLRKALEEAPTDVRQVVLTALHALSQWREATEGRR
jgi:hypothetical protein